MRRKDISFEFTNINSKLIEEAAEYRYSNKKLIRVLALAACIAVLVTVIPLSLIMNRGDQVQTPETTLTPGKDSNTDSVIVEPKPMKVIYCDASSVSPQYLETNLFKDKNIKVENFERFHIVFEWKEEFGTIDWTPDIPEKLTLSLSNKEYTANFDIAYSSSNTNNEVLKEYAKIARYKIEGTENKFIYYRVATKTIIDVDNLPVDYSNYGPNYTPKYSSEELTELARQDIKSIYGEDILEKYSTISYITLPEMFECYITFKRMINDYDTDSYITMTYTKEGELERVESNCFGMYDFTEHLLNEKELLELDKEAQELIKEKLVCEKKMMIHIDGYMCVRYVVYMGDDERGSPITAEIFFRLE